MKPLRRALVLALALGLLVGCLHITVLHDHFVLSGYQISPADQQALKSLHSNFQQCVAANAYGLTTTQIDLCRIRFVFSSATKTVWRNPKTGELEGLSYDFNLCEVLSVWEQIRNSSTILTREYIEAIPDGWHTYAWERINKADQLNNCENVTLCQEKLALVLPQVPPFKPHQYGRCAVVGNSGDLLRAKFGKEIDSYDAVIRGNGAPTKNFSIHVGTKSTFRLLNRGSAKALDKVAALDESGREILIIKTTVHDAITKMIQQLKIRNPVFLMLGMHLGAAAKGTGLKALEFALSLCETVDIYGFTVDPGYQEWTRYFSESRGGHAPLQGRAYYHMMECLGLITIHSPMRNQLAHRVHRIPTRETLNLARRASDRACNKLAGGRSDPLAACSIQFTRASYHHNSRLPEAASVLGHLVGGVTMYPLPHSTANEMLCVVPVKMSQ